MSEDKLEERLRLLEQNVGILSSKVIDMSEDIKSKDDVHRQSCPFLVWQKETKGRYTTFVVASISVILFILGSMGTIQLSKTSVDDFKDFKREISEQSVRRDERITALTEQTNVMFKDLMGELTELKITLISLNDHLERDMKEKKKQ